MASNATTADVAPEEVTQPSSDEDAGDIDGTNIVTFQQLLQLK